MVGYDDNCIYVHDNSKKDIQQISIEDISLAWKDGYIGLSKKNAYFGIDMKFPDINIKDIIQTGLRKTSTLFLNPPVGFMGIKGFEHFIKEFPLWKTMYDKDTLKNIYMHFITFTGSVLPEPPAQFDNHASGIKNPHRGARDSLSAALLKYRDTFGDESWERYAKSFEQSGEVIEQVVNGFTEDILKQSFHESEKYIELFKQIKQIETQAYTDFLYCTSQDKDETK
ncbi:DUF4872 domain-containing protein [Oscillospiraceae bacterium PP1C4]